MHCSVLSCKNCGPNAASTGTTFHKFPTEEDIRDQWILATGRDDWEPAEDDAICSLHFDESAYKRKGRTRNLDEDAIPTKALSESPTTVDDDETDAENTDTDTETNTDDDDSKEPSNSNAYAGLPSSKLIQIIEKLKTRNLKITKNVKRLTLKGKRAELKISLQNKIINDLMEIYSLKPGDINILRTEILKASE